MKKNSLLFLGLFLALNSFGQTIKTITTDVFSVIYSEPYQQPLRVNYWVQCPTGDADRTGMDFYEVKGVITSDDNDYKNNVWDKGHMAPAADFVCDDATLRKTFSYLNCALQHEGLNRGPWKELERFERDLAKAFWPVRVEVVVDILFEDEEQWLPTGALVPSGFRKTIKVGTESWVFEFPNANVAGRDWSDFRIE